MTETADAVTPPAAQPAEASNRALRLSLVISAIRCTLAYVVFPFVAPVIGLAPGVGPLVGLPIATVALVANVVSIRRFHRSNHRFKWPVSALNGGIIALVSILIVNDLITLLT